MSWRPVRNESALSSRLPWWRCPSSCHGEEQSICFSGGGRQCAIILSPRTGTSETNASWSLYSALVSSSGLFPTGRDFHTKPDELLLWNRRLTREAFLRCLCRTELWESFTRTLIIAFFCLFFVYTLSLPCFSGINHFRNLLSFYRNPVLFCEHGTIWL